MKNGTTENKQSGVNIACERQQPGCYVDYRHEPKAWETTQQAKAMLQPRAPL